MDIRTNLQYYSSGSFKAPLTYHVLLDWRWRREREKHVESFNRVARRNESYWRQRVHCSIRGWTLGKFIAIQDQKPKILRMSHFAINLCTVILQSEYVAPRYKRRQWISGFTGSQGTAVITESQAALWTDGRYFEQAENELDNNWILMKEGKAD